MRQAILGLFIACLIPIVGNAHDWTKQAEYLVERTFSFGNSATDGTTGRCSAFVLDKGWAMTAAHCVHSKHTGETYTITFGAKQLAVIALDHSIDVGIIEAPQSLRNVRTRFGTPGPIGEAVYMGAKTYTIDYGLVGHRVVRGSFVSLYQFYPTFGNSGAPIINRDKDVVGLGTHRLVDEHLSKATNGDVLKQFVDDVASGKRPRHQPFRS
jgi:hypothetical protein